jgi:hypothetical protein
VGGGGAAAAAALTHEPPQAPAAAVPARARPPGIEARECLGLRRRGAARSLARPPRTRRLPVRDERRAGLHQACRVPRCARTCPHLLAAAHPRS